MNEVKYSRASIFLNNTGVSLVERGYFSTAIATLTDAVKVIKTLHQQQDETFFSYEQVTSSLHLANCRAATMTPFSKNGPFVVVSHNQADYVSILPITALALIRIEEDNDDEIDLDLVYAVILANLSLLLLLVCRGLEETKYASTCLHLAHSLLDNLFQRYHSCGDVILLKRVAHLSTIVLSTLITTLQSIGQEQEAETVRLELFSLYQIAEALDGTGLFSSRDMLAACAA
jgi:hypothetical protein